MHADAAAEEAKRLRRHWVISGVATICVLLAGVVHELASVEKTPECTIDHDKFLVDVWDAPTRASIQQHLVAGSPTPRFGSELLESLDEHVDTWTILASSTCDELAKAGGKDSGLLIQRHCLVARLRELEAAVRELEAENDPQLWLEAVDGLGAIEDCDAPETARPVVEQARAVTEAQTG